MLTGYRLRPAPKPARPCVRTVKEAAGGRCTREHGRWLGVVVIEAHEEEGVVDALDHAPHRGCQRIAKRRFFPVRDVGPPARVDPPWDAPWATSRSRTSAQASRSSVVTTPRGTRPSCAAAWSTIVWYAARNAAYASAPCAECTCSIVRSHARQPHPARGTRPHLGNECTGGAIQHVHLVEPLAMQDHNVVAVRNVKGTGRARAHTEREQIQSAVGRCYPPTPPKPHHPNHPHH